MTADSEVDPAVRRALEAFALLGECTGLIAHHKGHIHDTFVSTFEGPDGVQRFLHQKLNEHVFTDIEALMHNIACVTRELAEKSRNESLELVPAASGAPYARVEGRAWRTFRYKEDTLTLDRVREPGQAFEAARMFAAYQADLAELHPNSLRMTIPDFFSGPHRRAQLRAAVQADRHGRAALAEPEIRFARENASLCDAIDKHLASGALPVRIVHGDTKLNNVLFDALGRRARCVVDLDTTMPAWSTYDFGDLVRFTAATCEEDEVDLAAVDVDVELLRALLAGWLESSSRFATDLERELLSVSSRLVTFLVGMRFLTDHLQGDVYFKTARADHNLDRARVQFRLVEKLTRHAQELRA